MIVYDDLLKIVASEKKHTFISTGLSTLADIDKAVQTFQDAGCPFDLMHCISTYPMKDEDANLRMIQVLKDRYSCKVGYSGHENGRAVSVAAAALGITSLERHLTLDRTMYGSDQPASIQDSDDLVDAIRKMELMIGDGVKKVYDSEVPIAAKLRKVNDIVD